MYRYNTIQIIQYNPLYFLLPHHQSSLPPCSSSMSPDLSQVFCHFILHFFEHQLAWISKWSVLIFLVVIKKFRNVNCLIIRTAKYVNFLIIVTAKYVNFLIIVTAKYVNFLIIVTAKYVNCVRGICWFGCWFNLSAWNLFCWLLCCKCQLLDVRGETEVGNWEREREWVGDEGGYLSGINSSVNYSFLNVLGHV